MGHLNQSWPDLFEKAASLVPRLAGLRGKRGIALKFHWVDLGNNSKLDIADSTVGGFIALKKAGEERLLDAAISGRIPLSIAMEIAKADTPELQRELMKGYESKQFNYVSIRVVKRLIDQRRFAGKQREANPQARKSRTSVESLVNTYKRESQRQKLLVKKARLCEAKLLFVVTAFGKLLGDENFVTLLRAEGVAEMPKYMHDRLNEQRRKRRDPSAECGMTTSYQ